MSSTILTFGQVSIPVLVQESRVTAHNSIAFVTVPVGC